MTDKEFYIKQMERIEGALARKFSTETRSAWWNGGVVKYGYEREEIEYAATQLGEGDDKFPTLSNFIYYCGAGRRKRREAERLNEQREEAKSRDLSLEGIFEQGSRKTQSPKAQAACKNIQRFLRGDISRDQMAKNQDEIEKRK